MMEEMGEATAVDSAKRFEEVTVEEVVVSSSDVRSLVFDLSEEVGFDAISTSFSLLLSVVVP